MPGYSLHELDQRTVAVEFPVNRDMRVVMGRGRIVASEPTYAPALHVSIQELGDAFEFVFDIERFTGLVELGERFACDFAIRLSDACHPLLQAASCQSPAGPRTAAA